MSQVILGNELLLDAVSDGADMLLLDGVSEEDVLLLGPVGDDIEYMVAVRLLMIGERIYE